MSSKKRNRYAGLGLDNVDEELVYAAELCRRHRIREANVFAPLVHGERAAMAPLCRQLLARLKAQLAAWKAHETKQVRARKYLEPKAVNYLAARMVHLCAAMRWPPPPELARLVGILLHGDSFAAPHGWSYARDRALYAVAREPDASAREISRDLRVSHTLVDGWFKDDDFKKARGTAVVSSASRSAPKPAPRVTSSSQPPK